MRLMQDRSPGGGQRERDGWRVPYPVSVKRAVLLYGICGGLLIAALEFIEYRFLVVEHSLEIYGGLIALVFAGVGIWLGLTLTKTKEVLVVREVPVPASPGFVRNDARVVELGITPASWKSSSTSPAARARGRSRRRCSSARTRSRRTPRACSASSMSTGARRR